MREQHRLGVLEVSASGHDHVEVVARLGGQGVNEVEHLAGDDPDVVAQEHLEQGGDLVVAAPAGAQPSAHLRTDLLQQEPLEGAVDVLVGRRWMEVARGVPLPQSIKTALELGQVAIGEQAGAVQGVGVRPRTGQVVGRQPPVEVGRAGQRLQLRRGALGEAAAPELAGAGDARRACVVHVATPIVSSASRMTSGRSGLAAVPSARSSSGVHHPHARTLPTSPGSRPARLGSTSRSHGSA